jgi:histone-arginine methyltransferase CARM1
MNGDDADPRLVAVEAEWRALHSLHYRALASQQHMLLDAHRMGAYHRGITHNARDFAGKTVLDVGAGSGILALFAAQAGARKVYAVDENPTECARTLVAANGVADRVEVIQARLEELRLPERVDVIISEPWGFFLFHERMVEAFVIARDRFLAPGGRLFPGSARVHLAPFSDAELHGSRASALSFWTQANFYGVDLRAMASNALDELFAMPALGYVAPETLVAAPATTPFDFETLPLGALAEIRLPFTFTALRDAVVHGLAGWFDVAFEGTSERVVLTTAPDAPETHWSQLRFVFVEPLTLRRGETVTGTLTLSANSHSSYTARFEAELVGSGPVPAQSFSIENYFPADEPQ